MSTTDPVTALLAPVPGESVEGEEQPKPRNTKKALIMVLVIALVAGGLFYKEKAKLFPPHYSAAHPAPYGQILTLSPVTVNLSDGHLLQATMALQLTTAADQTAVNNDTPRFLDAEIDVLGAQTDAGILAPGGRAATKAAILTACQQIAGEHEGSQQIVAVYYTNFISQ